MSSITNTEIVRYVYFVNVGTFSLLFQTVEDAQKYIERSGAQGTVSPLPVYRLQ
jgi:hypothetical protein